MSLRNRLILMVFIISSILMAGLTFLPEKVVAAVQQITVTGASVNIRGGPETDSPLVSKASKGQKFTVLKESKGWYQVDLGKGKKGWVAGWLVTKPVAVKVSPTSTGVQKAPAKVEATVGQAVRTLTVKGTKVNVRSGPGTGYSLAGQAQAKESLIIKGESKGWYKVTLNNGKEAWIAGWLVTVNKPVIQVNPSVNKTASTDNGSKTPVVKPNVGAQVGTQKTVVVKGTYLNVRSGPGTNFGIVFKALKGQELRVTTESKGWYKVNLTSTKEGWVASWLTEIKQLSVSRSGETGGIPKQETPKDTGGANTGEIGTIPGDIALPPGNSTQQPNDSTQQPNDTVLPPNDPGVPPGGTIPLPIVPRQPVINQVYLDVTQDDNALRVTVRGNQVMKYQVIGDDGLLTRITLEKAIAGQGILPVEMANLKEVSYQTFGEPGLETTEIQLSWAGATRYFIKSLPGKKAFQVVIPFSDLPLAGRTVVVDAGHGGIDPGAVGATGLKEKDVAWDMTQGLVKLLQERGAQVILSRLDDTKIPLLQRTQVANEKGADIFVSIHTNASTNRQVNGTATYYYAPSSLPALYEQAGERKKLALAVQNELIKELGRKDNGILQGNFAVIRETLMPSVLVETAFISNSTEEALLADSQFRARAAQAIARGIEAYFQQ
ncbi:MAG: N-acetylmuramoyl-L-alanine amidase [Clostridia bacterium]|nr:N-acetylmuramoyl-L-alanine amidase [Clostridia bacterium]